VQAFGSSGSTVLRWLSSPGATAYSVYGGTDPDNLAVLASGLTEPTAALMGLPDGVAHYFRVVAQTPAGDTAPSATVQVTPGSVPAAPDGLTATAQRLGARLQWTPVPSATQYDVYVATSPNGQVTPFKTDVVGTSASIEDLDAGIPHYFKVAAKNAYGAGLPSAEASAVPTLHSDAGGGGGGGGGGALSVTLTFALAAGFFGRRRALRRRTTTEA
jgi:hypothetical protein